MSWSLISNSESRMVCSRPSLLSELYSDWNSAANSAAVLVPRAAYMCFEKRTISPLSSMDGVEMYGGTVGGANEGVTTDGADVEM